MVFVLIRFVQTNPVSTGIGEDGKRKNVTAVFFVLKLLLQISRVV